MIKKLTAFVLTFFIFLGFSCFNVMANESATTNEVRFDVDYVPGQVVEVINGNTLIVIKDEDTLNNDVITSIRTKSIYDISNPENLVWKGDIAIYIDYIKYDDRVNVIYGETVLIDKPPSSDLVVMGTYVSDNNEPVVLVVSHSYYTNQNGQDMGSFVFTYVRAIERGL